MSGPIHNQRIADLLHSQPVAPRAAQGTGSGGGVDFAAVLSDRLKVSNHAKTRLQSREIELDAAKWERVMEGVEKAAAKGARESLVMVDDVALVVSVKNRTVITAVSQASLRENVFTNIDSAVIV